MCWYGQVFWLRLSVVSLFVCWYGLAHGPPTTYELTIEEKSCSKNIRPNKGHLISDYITASTWTNSSHIYCHGIVLYCTAIFGTLRFDPRVQVSNHHTLFFYLSKPFDGQLDMLHCACVPEIGSLFCFCCNIVILFFQKHHPSGRKSSVTTIKLSNVRRTTMYKLEVVVDIRHSRWVNKCSLLRWTL